MEIIIKKNLPWNKFEEESFSYLNGIYYEVKLLAEEANKKDISLLCIEDSPEKCHRRLLAERCKEICPDLKILIN